MKTGAVRTEVHCNAQEVNLSTLCQKALSSSSAQGAQVKTASLDRKQQETLQVLKMSMA